VILIVKSPIALPVLLTTLMLSACGQPGPLYLPKPPSRPGAAASAPPPAPAPVNTATPPAPAAGTVAPSAGSNANNTQAPQQQPAPANQ
jgi:predicted small lipoprotein YifL